MNELKPCPFCGGKAGMLMTTEVGTPSGDKGTKVVVFCGNRECGCKVVKWALKIGWAKESAIKAWNRRANQGQADKVAELELVKQERDAAVKDMQEIMALTSEMRVCTKYCVNGHCYNRGGNMPCSPRWDASWSGHKMED